MPKEMDMSKEMNMLRELMSVLKEKEMMSMGTSKEMSASKEMSMNGRGGHLYMQTNEAKNCIIHYHRSANGTLTEVERAATGGAGSGTFKPISGQDSAPNSFEGASSVILSPDRRFLFATNGGDNSVSSFGRKERHCQIAGIFSVQGHALRGPLLRPRSYPAHVGLQWWQAYAAHGAIHGEYTVESTPCSNYGCALTR